MEAHPIPQNVTSFQFKLVGDMTIKQFAYLGGGCVIGYLIFVIFGSTFPFIAFPLAGLSALFGAAFAFLPIGDRPLDHWMVAFFKAVYSPTKLTWKKNGKTYDKNPTFQTRKLFLYATPAPTPIIQPIPNISPQLSGAFQPFQPPLPPVNHPVPQTRENIATQQAGLPTTKELAQTVELAKQAQDLQVKIIQTERQLSQIKTASNQPSPIPMDYSKQVNTVLAQLQTQVEQAAKIQEKLHPIDGPEEQAEGPFTPAQKVKVTVVGPMQKVNTQLSLTTFPNVINGIVSDNANNYLENVVIVIHDKEGLPVRALKTNKLGQFTGSTPLPNGTYTVEIEKDGYVFDVLQIELNGALIAPLRIVAKGGATSS